MRPVYFTLLLALLSPLIWGQNAKAGPDTSLRPPSQPQVASQPVNFTLYKKSVSQQADGWHVEFADQRMVTRIQGVYKDKGLRKMNGYFVYYHPNGMKAQAGLYRNSLKEGNWRSWSQNGILLDSTHFYRGRREGDFFRYYPDGKLQVRGYFQSNEASGTWYRYASSGDLLSKLEYERGMIIASTYYNASGQALTPAAIRGHKAGLVFFDDWFEPEQDVNYATYFGEPEKLENGSYRVIMNNMQGRKVAVVEYSDRTLQTKSGFLYRYDINGKVRLAAYFSNNYLTGPFVRWYENGEKSDSGYMKKGLREGNWTSWNPNGSKKDSGNYVGNLREGLWTEWPDQGTEWKGMGLYKNGKKVGDWKYYDHKGRILYVKRFRKWQFSDAEIISIN
jgi:antitoxin component YwqK of YwqJK toxin-antitoxin module